MFLGGRNCRNKVRIVKTHAELDHLKEIKTNNKTFYQEEKWNHSALRARLELAVVCIWS